MSVNVVSTCLFGGPQASRHRSVSGDSGTEFYRRYLPAWVRAHHNVFNGWRWTLHHDGVVDDSLPGIEYADAIRQLAAADLIDLVYCGPAVERNAALLWRLKPLFDPLVDILICRDLDSLPTPKDRLCVREFMAWDLAEAHGINDSISHCFALGGGMCGFKAPTVRRRLKEIGIETWYDLLAMASRGKNWQTPGQEQSFLNGPVLQLLRNQTIVHDFKRTADVGYAELCVGPPADDYDAGRKPHPALPHFTADLWAAADGLMPHLGASGFDVERAIDFWQVNGDPEIEQRIATCESFGPDGCNAAQMSVEGTG